MNERKLRIPTDSIRISRHLVVWQSGQLSQIQTPHMPGARTTTLLVTPGNGTQTGSQALASLGFPVVGVAPTIDNDLCGSDITIGVDTALSIALAAVAGKIRSAYERGKPHALVVAAEGTSYNARSSTSPARWRSGTGRLARPAAR